MRTWGTPWPIRAPCPAARTRGRTKRRATTATVAASSGATEVAALLRRRRASRAPCARRTTSSTRTRSSSHSPGPSVWCAWRRARASSLTPAATASFVRRAWCDSEGFEECAIVGIETLRAHSTPPLTRDCARDGRTPSMPSLRGWRCMPRESTKDPHYPTLSHSRRSAAPESETVSLGNPTYQKRWWMRRRPRPCRPSTTIAP